MALKSLKIITTLVLLYSVFCCAILHGLDLETDERGIKIVSAHCNGRKYEVEELYQAVAKGMESVRSRVESHMNLEAIQFKAKPEFDFPFSPPYYSRPLHSTLKALSQGFQLDIIIFTGDGRLVTVIFAPWGPLGSLSSLESTYSNCILTPKRPSVDMDPPSKRRAVRG